MDVVLCWHMHQPDYRLAGRYLKPWTWLHAVKDYTDMAAHLESVAGARAVVNFSPVLIEQLQDYPRRIRTFLDRGEPIGDFVLDGLGRGDVVQTSELLAQLLRVNEQRMKDRFAPYSELYDRADEASRHGPPLTESEVTDLLVWYVLVWLGESLRGHSFITGLVRKGRDFSMDDRHRLLGHIAEVIDGVLPRYAALAKRGKVELSVTPYSHPILPLLLDFQSAREAMPDAGLPQSSYSGGEARCDWQLDQARGVFLDAFGIEPQGCWPSEGAVSEEVLTLLGRHHFGWTASGSAVLANSLTNGEDSPPSLSHLHAWRLEDDGSPACFFRDDGLSDLIGFEYSKWPADKAASDFISHLEHRRAEALAAGNESPVLSIIMDGENAWEYFPENGWAFLQELYAALTEHPDFRPATFSEVVERCTPRTLPRLCAGSWVHGNLATWIGEPAKNRAWELLAEAKVAVDRSGLASDHAVLRQLAICEASDWMWWLGEEVALRDAPAFDALFRTQLAQLYRMIDLDAPRDLDSPISRVSDLPDDDRDVVGAMRRSS